MSNPAASSSSNMLLVLTVSATSGFLFGFALEKGQVFSPQKIVGQMLFNDWTMMKMFLTAAATSMLSLILLQCSPRGTAAVDHVMCRKTEKGLLVTAAGGALLGAGMALAGACPGTILAQIGSGQSNSVSVFSFGLFGAALYAFAERVGLFVGINPVWFPKADKANKVFNIPYVAASSTMSALLIATVTLIESRFPSHLPLIPTTLSARAWSPISAGVIIGSLQIPMLLVTGKTIGSSSAFVTIVASALNWVVPSLVRNTKVLAEARAGLVNWIQPVYLLGAVSGAFASSVLSRTWHVPNGISLSPLSAAIGGAALIFGARLADGCTSGHGISGFSLLSFRSMAATAAMFAGGITVAHMMRAWDFYPARI